MPEYSYGILAARQSEPPELDRQVDLFQQIELFSMVMRWKRAIIPRLGTSCQRTRAGIEDYDLEVDLVFAGRYYIYRMTKTENLRRTEEIFL